MPSVTKSLEKTPAHPADQGVASTGAGAGPAPVRVLAMIDTRQVSGPCRGLFQLRKLADRHGVELLFGMFARVGEPPRPALAETRRRGLPVTLFVERGRFDPRLILQAWRTVRRAGVEIVQSHGYKPAALAWCLRRLTGLPWVAFAHGYTSENRRMSLYNRLDRWLMRQADRLVVMSEVMAQQFIAAGAAPDRVRIVHNAIDQAEYQPGADGTALRNECRAGADTLLVGVIGRFSSEKGQDVFLRALASVVRIIPTVRAALIGDGLDADRLRSTVQRLHLDDHVVFAGHRKDVSAVYAALDLVVIPSLSEGLPNVLLEALLHGKPVVATKVGAIPEVMRGELQRWLVPPGDCRALAHAMTDALTDQTARRSLGRAGQGLVLESFSPARRMARVMAIYREVARA